VQSAILGMTVYAPFYLRLRSAVDFIVPIPAFLFLRSAGLLSRTGRIAGAALTFVLASLAIATFAAGPSRIFHVINNVIIIAALAGVVARSVSTSEAGRDFVVIRRGLLFFAAFALWDNLAGALAIPSPIVEPFGFAGLLISLGIVAGRRTLQRDEQLSEIQKELEVARRIQMSILPPEFPTSPHFQVAARYVPMTSVAGDFYDYVVADQGQAGLLIADVSGHGIPAALIASMVKLAAASQRAHATNPAGFLAGMNAALRGNTQNQFVTAAYVHLDSESRQLRYSAAGHPPMLLLRNGEVIKVEENGLMLAVFDFATYSNTTHKLEPGDRLLLYTDGIVDAANAAGDFFGHQALCEALTNTSGLAAPDAADSILSSVQRWSAAQDDDLTVLVCDYVGDSK
jgi:phosphoserine phosphatase RsbU/P